FHFPVVDQRRGHDQQRRSVSRVLFGLEEGQSLYGLSKTHIIGKASAKPVFVQKAQPVVSGLLIRSQLSDESFRDGIILYTGKRRKRTQPVAEMHFGQIALFEFTYQVEMVFPEYGFLARALRFAEGKQVGILRQPDVGDNGDFPSRKSDTQ